MVHKESPLVEELTRTQPTLQEHTRHRNYYLLATSICYDAALRDLVNRFISFGLESIDLLKAELVSDEPCQNFHMGFDCSQHVSKKGVACKKNHARVTEEVTFNRLKLRSQQLYYSNKIFVMYMKYKSLVKPEFYKKVSLINKKTHEEFLR